MWPAVRNAFVRVNSPLEGVCSWMYLDVKGLVTTSIGVLIDSIAAAQALPWLRADGSRATRDEIAAEWMRIKAMQSRRKIGGGKFKQFTTLRLDNEGLLAAVSKKLGEKDAALAKRFPEYSAWCADAQLAVLSLAWAAGSDFRFPKMEAALRRQDFLTAAKECDLDVDGPDNILGTDDDNPGVAPRNDMNRRLLKNAHVVHRDELDPDILYWPRDLLAEPAQPRAGGPVHSSGGAVLEDTVTRK